MSWFLFGCQISGNKWEYLGIAGNKWEIVPFECRVEIAECKMRLYAILPWEGSRRSKSGVSLWRRGNLLTDECRIQNSEDHGRNVYRVLAWAFQTKRRKNGVSSA